jgi:hypothetical protein
MIGGGDIVKEKATGGEVVPLLSFTVMLKV